ncbi:MAG: AI-2E family transporter [Nanoarchaeota archaeon]|nr:AI-2E family transporter [Nanoarchaeota archaeon]
MEIQKYSKYSLILFFLVIIALSIYLLLPFLTELVAVAVITYVFYPLFKKLNKHIKNRSLCSLVMVLIILLIIIIPLFLIVNALFIEAVNFYQGFRSLNLAPLSNLISNIAGETIDIQGYAQELADTIVSFIVRSASDFFFSLPQKLIVLFVTVFVMYYFFKDGDKIVDFLEKVSPIHKDHKSELLAEFNKVVYAILYGVLVTAAIQGIVGTIGLVVFDVPSPIIWGSIMILTAIIPFVGTWLIWLPASLFKIFNGDLFNGFGLLIYGALIVSTIDNLIKPKLISQKSQIHPILIILGVFGGLKAFGLIGVMIGPLLLGTLSLLYSFYIKK